MDASTCSSIVGSYGTPTFVYSEASIIENVGRIRNAAAGSGIRNRVHLYVPYFANSNPHIFYALSNLGVGAVIQSVEEQEQLRLAGLRMPKIVSSTHLSEDDIDYFLGYGLQINAATSDNLRYLIGRGAEKLSIRLDLSSESDQRHGFRREQFGAVRSLLDASGRRLHGIHIYPGTGSDLETHLRYQRRALECILTFPELAEINLGGGFDFSYDGEIEKHFDWASYFLELKNRAGEFRIGNEVDLTFEPGRDILADAGQLITRVNGIEKSSQDYYEIYTDCSYVHMPSSTIRERQHRLEFLSDDFRELGERDHDGLAGKLSGNTTLSSDHVFPGIVHFPHELSKGSYVVLSDVGAYCATQHLEFLNKRPCAEVLVRANGKIQLIARRGDPADRIRYVTALGESDV